jgi:SAM-dependent methyltransferase
VHAYRAGGYDWLEIWRRMYEQERAQGESATAADFAVGPDFWAGQADRFARAAARSRQPDGFLSFVLPRLRAGDHVLDVGAGSGRYVPLLAAHAAHVTALEPSPAMLRHLQTHAFPNLDVVEGRWPEISVPEVDVAISAHVLYGVRDLAPFLLAMQQVARRACFLYLAIQHPASFISPFWERIHGTARLPLPGALECLNALYQLGIDAHLDVIPLQGSVLFKDEDEALADIRWRLRVGPDPQRDNQIRSAIRELLMADDEQQLHPPDPIDRAAVIWWETQRHA